MKPPNDTSRPACLVYTTNLLTQRNASEISVRIGAERTDWILLSNAPELSTRDFQQSLLQPSAYHTSTLRMVDFSRVSSQPQRLSHDRQADASLSLEQNEASFPPAPLSEPDPDEEPRALSRGAWARQPVALTSSSPAPSPQLQVPRPRRPPPPLAGQFRIEPPLSRLGVPHDVHLKVLHFTDDDSSDMSAARTRPWFRSESVHRTYPATGKSVSDIAMSSVQSESSSTTSEFPNVSLPLHLDRTTPRHLRVANPNPSENRSTWYQPEGSLRQRRIVGSKSAFEVFHERRKADNDPPLIRPSQFPYSRSQHWSSHRGRVTEQFLGRPHVEFSRTTEERRNCDPLVSLRASTAGKADVAHHNSRSSDATSPYQPVNRMKIGNETISSNKTHSLPRRRGFRNKPSKNHLTFHVSTSVHQSLNRNSFMSHASTILQSQQPKTEVRTGHESRCDDSSPSQSELSARANGSEDSYNLHMEHRRASVFASKSRRIRSALSRIMSRMRP